MEVVNRMIESQTLLFLYILTGVVIFKLGIVKEEHRRSLVRLLMDVAMPCMILDAFDCDFTADEMRRAGSILALSTVIFAIALVVGKIVWRKEPLDRKNVLMYGTAFSNAGTAGLPVVSLVFGEVGVFFASMYLIPPRILQWSWGLGMFATAKKEKSSLVKNVLFNPMMVVVYIGFILMAFGLHIPGALGKAVKSVGDMTAPLSMMLIGGTLSAMKPKALFSRDVLAISAIRLLAMPILSALVFKPFALDPLAVSVAVTLSAMPVASNTAAITERYGGDVPFASACVSVSTLISIVSVPLITWINQLLLT